MVKPEGGGRRQLDDGLLVNIMLWFGSRGPDLGLARNLGNNVTERHVTLTALLLTQEYK